MKRSTNSERNAHRSHSRRSPASPGSRHSLKGTASKAGLSSYLTPTYILSALGIIGLCGAATYLIRNREVIENLFEDEFEAGAEQYPTHGETRSYQ